MCSSYLHQYANGDWNGCDGDCKSHFCHTVGSSGVMCYCHGSSSISGIVKKNSDKLVKKSKCDCNIKDLMVYGKCEGCPG